MAPKKSTIVLNVEKFIRDVEERPAIWNRNFHCNKTFLEQMWDELSNEHKLPKVILKAKWKGLRDNFRVEYKRIPRSEGGEFLVEPQTFESKWIHYYALLFLTEHMRHRWPKPESNFFFPQQSQDCEKTIVEPDLTNGLIRRLQDSDEEFDEDDVEEDDEETAAETPPAAHSQSLTTIKKEDGRALLKSVASAFLKSHVIDSNLEKEVQDLSKKPPPCNTTKPTSPAPTALVLTTTSNNNSNHSNLPISTSSNINNASISSINNSTNSNQNRASPTLHISSSTNSASNTRDATSISTTQQHKKRSVSPPPLYNKAHHPLPLNGAGVKERDDYALNGSNCLHGSHEHLNFTKHSYANGLIPAIKLKRPRLSEDSNFNGSSTMDIPVGTVPEDDDYHYLLSLHPYMKQLTAAQKLRIRTKIQKLIFKELYKEDLEETSK